MTGYAAKVLVIEDEKQIRRFVRVALEAEGCQVSEADTMAQGLIDAGTRKPDLLILDLGLPDGNGIDLIRDVRGWSDVPVLILSARTQEHDKIDALDAGADDYLTKPFSVGELRARVRALLRRRSRSPEAASPVIEFGQVMVDLSRRLVTRDGAGMLAELHLHADAVTDQRIAQITNGEPATFDARRRTRGSRAAPGRQLAVERGGAGGRCRPPGQQAPPAQRDGA